MHKITFSQVFKIYTFLFLHSESQTKDNKAICWCGGLLTTWLRSVSKVHRVPFSLKAFTGITTGQQRLADKLVTSDHFKGSLGKTMKHEAGWEDSLFLSCGDILHTRWPSFECWSSKTISNVLLCEHSKATGWKSSLCVNRFQASVNATI